MTSIWEGRTWDGAASAGIAVAEGGGDLQGPLLANAANTKRKSTFIERINASEICTPLALPAAFTQYPISQNPNTPTAFPSNQP